MHDDPEHWDAFVCHASEDKHSFVRPLVDALGRLGVSLWYDEVSLKIGNSLSGTINRAIAKSRNAIIVVSPAFLAKKWPEAELNALMTLRIEEQLTLLPIWHNVGRADVAAHSPMLADLFSLTTEDRAAQDIAIALLAAIRPDLYEWKGRSELEHIATGRAFEELQEELADLREKVSDLLCPTCGAPVNERMFAYDDRDPNQVDIEIFECGFSRGGRYPQACPHDPDFPAFTDYELICEEASSGTWYCRVVPRTAGAKRHHLASASGNTEAQARARIIEQYNRTAPCEKRVPMD